MKKLIVEKGVLKRYAGFEHNYRVSADIRIIGQHAFRGNCSMKTVVIPDGVVEIGDEAYRTR